MRKNNPLPRTKMIHEQRIAMQQAEKEEQESAIKEAKELKRLEVEEEAKCIEEHIWKNCNLVRMQEDTSNLIEQDEVEYSSNKNTSYTIGV